MSQNASNASSLKTTDTLPPPRSARKSCARCQDLHLKCVWDDTESQSSCVRCERVGFNCQLGTRKTRFRNVVFAEPGQKAAKASKTYPDKLITLRDEPSPPIKFERSNKIVSEAGLDQNAIEPQQPLPFSQAFFNRWKERANIDPGNMSDIGSIQQPSPSIVSPAMNAVPDARFGGYARAILQTKLSSQRALATVDDNYLEYLLVRYFYEELVPFFDWCDPDHHFATVLPRKIGQAGPLRHALLTFAARHFARTCKDRDDVGMLDFGQHSMHNWKEELAMHYHNACIHDLIRLGGRPENLQDESLLAAVIILRTDEEMGFSMDEEQQDQQIFLNLANSIIFTQLPNALALPHTSLTITEPIIDPQLRAAIEERYQDNDTDGLRQSCIWTALRQDLHAAMSTQKPIKFPLARCESFRRSSPAPDAVWPNRLVTLCADVAEFAFGSDSCDGRIDPAHHDRKRWEELRQREENLSSSLPRSFWPTFAPPLGRLHGVFPEIWYLNNWVICSITYLELARMLLAVFNPTMPKYGYGSKAAMLASITTTKASLIRLCGIALSNGHCSPSLINACLGISFAGECFDDPVERQGLLEVLTLMYNRHAYKALSSRIAVALTKEWEESDASRDD